MKLKPPDRSFGSTKMIQPLGEFHWNGEASPLLEVNDLAVTHRGSQYALLEGVSFTLEHGQFGIIIGRSGVGKSLLFQAILGLLPPDRWKVTGSISFKNDTILGADGYQWDTLQRRLGRDIMAIFQEPTSYLHPSLSIGWQIKEMWHRHPWHFPLWLQQRVRERLRSVALEDDKKVLLLPRLPFQLSQGQQQRIMIAMALCCSDLVLADEPTSALDEENETRIVTLLCELRQQKQLRSMLAITHNLDAFRSLLRPGDWIMEIKTTTGVGRAGPPHPVPTVIDLAEETALQSPSPSTEDSKTSVLSVKNLAVEVRRSFWQPPQMILKEITFTVREGEFFSITGPSGSGKTTLAKAILGILPAKKGHIFYHPPHSGNSLDLANKTASDPARQQSIQMIFQDTLMTFNPKMTIGDTFREILHYAGEQDAVKQRERVVPLLQQLGLTGQESDADLVLQRFPSEFSGGQRQRLGVARALLLRPRLIIADEPFASQDIETSLEMFHLFRQLQREHGIAFVIISHDMRLVRRLCSRGIRLHNGTLDRANH